MNEFVIQINRTIISDFIKEKEKWLGLDLNLNQTCRITKGDFPQIEDFLLIWKSQLNSKNVTITGYQINIKAKLLMSNLNLYSFQESEQLVK